MCGIVGVVSAAPVNQLIYDALLLLQHRGQDAAGIVTQLERKFFMHKAKGMVRDVFRTRNMRALPGPTGLGQVRYPTAGNAYSEEEAQPFCVNAPFGLVLVHNGNLTNAKALKQELELVDSLKAREDSLAPAIATLTPDPKTGKPPLELGPLNNVKYQAQNAAGNSTVESRNYAALQRAVQEATNLKTDAAKGVQTDKDVLRFANELIAAFGGNDTKTTLEALSNFSKSTVKARENAQKRIDSRRKSQGVEPYYGPALGTASNPIKLD